MPAANRRHNQCDQRCRPWQSSEGVPERLRRSDEKIMGMAQLIIFDKRCASIGIS